MYQKETQREGSSTVPTDASASEHSSVDLVCTAEDKVTKVDVEDLVSEGSLLMNRSYLTSSPEDICCPTIVIWCNSNART